MKAKLHLFIITIILLSNSCKKKTKDEIIPSPQITNINPKQGAPGSKVAIKGSSLNASLSDIKVLFESLQLTINSVDDTSIVVTVPADAAEGLYKIHVSIGDQEASGNLTFTVVKPLHTIIDFKPIEGKTNDIITITGTGFGTSPIVKFNGTTATLEPGNTDTQIQVKVPSGATLGKISIIVNGKTAESPNDFKITSYEIITILPMSEKIGSLVTISGVGFGTNPIVKFNGATATLEPGNTDTQIKVKVPAGATSGKISITANNKTIESANDFNVITYQIESVNPEMGKIGSLVTISGVGFGATPIVKFNGTTATLEPGNTDTQIQVKVPAGATPGKITTIVNGKTAESPNDFNVITYQIESITPTSGRAGDLVTITGIGFGATPIVKFNGTTATLEPGNTDTQIQVKVPAGATSGKITTIVNGKTAEFATIFVLNPAIMSLSISTGRVGTYVEITADNLNVNMSDVKVLFGTIEATKVALVGSQISVLAPVPLTSASTVKVSLTVTGGVKSNEINFTYQASPTMLEQITGAMAGESVFCDNNGDIYSTAVGMNYDTYVLKAGSTTWTKIMPASPAINSYDIIKYNDNLYLPTYYAVYKIDVNTGQKSIFVNSATNAIFNDRFLGGSGDGQGNIYLPSFDNYSILKVSSNGSMIDNIYSNTGNKFFSTPTIIGNYIFTAYRDDNDGSKHKILKLNLSTKTPDPMFSYISSAYSISGIDTYNNKLYVILQGKGVVEIDPSTGASKDLFSFTGPLDNNGKKISINPSTGILYLTDHSNVYRFYLN